ncbi:MAG: hypothetical protein GY903_18995, partial [Fuerstiella sp.]|nr:hypothetical protein [Fuerstiella sp.]
MSDTTLIEGETATLTIVFSEAVASFASNDDVDCDSGSLAVMTSGNSITWTGTFTPTAETSDTTNTCDIATSYTDTIGNAGAAGATANYIVDGVDPEITSVGFDDTAMITGDTPTLTIVFTEAVAAFASADDVTCATGSLAAMSSSDDITWTGTFTPTANTEDATNICSVATSYTDAYGNGVGEAQDTANYAVETLAPTISSITNSDTTLYKGQTSTLTIVFNEAVAAFAAADVTCGSASVGSLSSGDSITWTGTVTPTANTEDNTNTCDIATTYTDTAGNTGPAGSSANYVVETLSPSASSITMSDTTLIEGETATFTIVFSETVAGFASADDVVCTSGSLAVMAITSGSTWAATFTPTADTTDTSNVCTLATSYTDVAGNAGGAATSANYIVDGVDPEITSVGFDDTAMKSGDTPTLTIVFTEAVASFASDDDVTCASGSLASMSSSDSITWTGTFTPTANTEDSSNICSVATSYTDAYGN